MSGLATAINYHLDEESAFETTIGDSSLLRRFFFSGGGGGATLQFGQCSNPNQLPICLSCASSMVGMENCHQVAFGAFCSSLITTQLCKTLHQHFR